MDYEKQKAIAERLDKEFPITGVSRADLEWEGFDTSSISDEDMEELANKMADAYFDSFYWQDMKLIAEEVLGFPKKLKDNQDSNVSA